MKRIKWLVAFMVAAMLMGGGAAYADGEFYVIASGGQPVGTKIASLPYTITKSGFYYLAGNLSSQGSGILVNTNDVTIDLAGFTLTGSGGEFYGVEINGRTNVEVRNGTVRGFYFGIGSDESSVRIINIRAESNTDTGIHVFGSGSLIMGCYAGNNIWGFDVVGSANVLNNVANNNSGIGFYMFNDPLQLLDRNVSSNNGTDWETATGCTLGINTPPPITEAAAAATVQKAPVSKRDRRRVK